MHELLFTNSSHLKEKKLLDYAAQLGLDLPRYQWESNDPVYLQRVQEHMQGACHLGVRSNLDFLSMASSSMCPLAWNICMH